MYFTDVDIRSNVIEATNFGDSKFMFHLPKSRIMKELCITHMEYPGRNSSVIYWCTTIRIAHQVGHHTGYIQSLISGRLSWFTKENYLYLRLSTYWALQSWGKRLQRVTRIVDLLLVRQWYFVKVAILLCLVKIVVHVLSIDFCVCYSLVAEVLFYIQSKWPTNARE